MLQLTYDAETGLNHAEARQYAAWMGRWTAPDPYNGSYDLANPQSLNRYAYVNNNPLGFVDPSGLAGGVTGWGGVCTIINDATNNSITNNMTFNPCNPVSYFASAGIYGVMRAFGFAGSIGEVVPLVTAAFTIACSVDNFNSSMCGPSGWTSIAFGKNSVVGKVINDYLAVDAAVACVAAAASVIGGGPCLVYAIYSVANAVFSWAWSALSGPQFTGSLLPRPAALDGLGSSATGIPDKNLSLQEILGQTSNGMILSPGINIP